MQNCSVFTVFDFATDNFAEQWPEVRPFFAGQTVAAHLNIPLNHHDADSDARACAEIILRAGQWHVEINRIIDRPVQERFDLFGGNY